MKRGDVAGHLVGAAEGGGTTRTLFVEHLCNFTSVQDGILTEERGELGPGAGGMKKLVRMRPDFVFKDVIP